MWWLIQKKILLDHPYFDFKDVVLTRKETEHIYDSGFPTFKEMIDSAKLRFNLPLEAWASFDEVIATRFTNSKQAGRKGFVIKNMRLAVVVMVLLLVISFFTLVPFGRALAVDFFEMFMRVIEGRIKITTQNSDYERYEFVNLKAEQYEKDDESDTDLIDENIVIFYPDIKEFVAKTGYTPVTIAADWLKCQSIQSFNDKDQGLTLTVKYTTEDGFLVVVTQRWNDKQNMTVQVEDAIYRKASILGSIELIYAIDPVDGSFNGIALLDDSLLMIGAEKGVDIDLLFKALR